MLPRDLARTRTSVNLNVEVVQESILFNPGGYTYSRP
jgi:hypothetical protein